MSKLIVKNKQVVVPGETLAEGMDYLPGNGTYRNNDEIISQILGLVNIDGRAVKLIPLSGRYSPKKNDTIIGKVTDIAMSGWIIEINSAYHSMLGLKDASSSFIERGADLTKFFDIGDHVVAQIIKVTSQKLVDLTMKGPGLRKLSGGRIMHVSPTKVPRIIGKQGSMINMVKQATNCNITVGQNGLVWLQGQPKDILRATGAIKKIDSESHVSGLTESIETYLKKK